MVIFQITTVDFVDNLYIQNYQFVINVLEKDYILRNYGRSHYRKSTVRDGRYTLRQLLLYQKGVYQRDDLALACRATTRIT